MQYELGRVDFWDIWIGKPLLIDYTQQHWLYHLTEHSPFGSKHAHIPFAGRIGLVGSRGSGTELYITGGLQDLPCFQCFLDFYRYYVSGIIVSGPFRQLGERLLTHPVPFLPMLHLPTSSTRN
jgi:hypothetical protein